MKKLNDFLFETGVDNLNIYKIEKYFQRSEIVKKVPNTTVAILRFILTSVLGQWVYVGLLCGSSVD